MRFQFKIMILILFLISINSVSATVYNIQILNPQNKSYFLDEINETKITLFGLCNDCNMGTWVYDITVNGGGFESGPVDNNTVFDSFFPLPFGTCINCIKWGSNFISMSGHDLSGGNNITNVTFNIVRYIQLNQSYVNSSIENTLSFTSYVNMSNVFSNMDAYLIWNGTSIKASKIIYPNNIYYFSASITPSISQLSLNVSWYWNYTFQNSSGNIVASDVTTAINQTIYKIYLGNCSDGISTTKTLHIETRNEETNSLINSTIEIDIHSTYNNVITENYTFNIINNSIYLCIYPSWGIYTTDGTIQYNATGYSNRFYSFYSELSNTSSTIILYLLDSNKAEQVIEYVFDESTLGIQDAIIKIQRYFASTGNYKTVAQLKTDFEGKDSTYLDVDNIYYRHVVEKNGIVLGTFPSTIIICASDLVCPPYILSFSISNITIPYYFKYYNKIGVTCPCINTTDKLICTITDSSGVSTTSRLIVEKLGALNFTTICDTSDSSSLLTLTCSLGNITGNVYRYRIYSYLGNGTETLTCINYLDDSSNAKTNWGDWGLFLVVILNLLFFFIGRWMPIISMILLLAGNIGFYAIGLLNINLEGIISMSFIEVLVIYLMNKVNE